MQISDEVLIVGCGYIGKRVARLAHEKGAKITALLRTPEKIDEIKPVISRTLAINLDDPSTLSSIPADGATIFYFAPPPGGGVLDPRARNFCDSIAQGIKPAKLIYLSTSGVYGDCGDLPVTEDTQPNPETARGKRRLDAEAVFTNWARNIGTPIVILRVTGIYGPGRLPLQHLMSGTPLLFECEAPVTNRIHADDLANACIAAAENGEDGDIFNISDGEHGTMTQYFNAVADLLGIERPQQVTRAEAALTMPPLLYSYFSESRRIDNSKMLKKLGVVLQYPNILLGLPSCKPENWPPIDTRP